MHSQGHPPTPGYSPAMAPMLGASRFDCPAVLLIIILFLLGTAASSCESSSCQPRQILKHLSPTDGGTQAQPPRCRVTPKSLGLSVP